MRYTNPTNLFSCFHLTRPKISTQYSCWNEQEQLKALNDNARNEVDAQIVELKKKYPPHMSNYKIAMELDINQMRVKRVLKRTFF